MAKAPIVYRLSPGGSPKPHVRRRDGQPCDPLVVRDAAFKLCAAKGKMTHEELCTSVYARGGASPDASEPDVRRYIATLLRRWQAGGWLATASPDGRPAPVRRPSGGRKRESATPQTVKADEPPAAQDAQLLQGIAADVAEIRRIVEQFISAFSAGLASERRRETGTFRSRSKT